MLWQPVGQSLADHPGHRSLVPLAVLQELLHLLIQLRITIKITLFNKGAGKPACLFYTTEKSFKRIYFSSESTKSIFNSNPSALAIVFRSSSVKLFLFNLLERLDFDQPHFSARAVIVIFFRSHNIFIFSAVSRTNSIAVTSKLNSIIDLLK